MQKKAQLSNIEFLFFNNITDETKYIREEVFVKEQGFIEEFDDKENSCIHALLRYNNLAAATARFYPINNNSWQIGRFAVMKEFRHKGIGTILIHKIEEKIKEKGGVKAVLSAQKQAEQFYISAGYTSYGDIYYDQHSPHIHMSKKL